MVTTKPFLKIWNKSLSWVILSSNQNYQIHSTFQTFLDVEMKGQTKMTASTGH